MKKAISLVKSAEILPDRVREIVDLKYIWVEDPDALSNYYGNEEEMYYFILGEEEIAKNWAARFERYAKIFPVAIIRIERDGKKHLRTRAFNKDTAAQILISFALEDMDEVDDKEITRTLAYEHDGVVWRALPFEFKINKTI